MAHAFDHRNASLSEGEALAAVVGVLPGKPYGTQVGRGFPASAAITVAGRRSACSRLGPLRRAWRGRKWRERPRVFWRWCATGEGGGGAHENSHRLPSPAGVAPSTVIPGGKAIERLIALTVDACSQCSFVVRLLLHVVLCVFMLRRVPLPIRVSSETRQQLQRLRTERHLNLRFWLRALIDEALEEQKTTDGQRPREARLEHAHKPISPIGSTGSLPRRLTVPEEESPGSNGRRICPPTSRMVQWIPVQIEGYNGGIEAG